MEMIKLQAPTFQDVLRARRQIAPYVQPTPLHRYTGLSDLVGAQVYVKHENYTALGAFKVRGGINLLSQMSQEERDRGVIAASTGNHGQSVANAARMFGAAARIVVPEGANPGKVAAMQGMGAEVIFHGAKFDDSVRHAVDLAQRYGYRYVHAGNEPLIIAGVATYVLEMLEQEPDLDVIFVPVGSGSGAAGACIAAHAINPQIKVIAAQSELAPAAYLSWRNQTIMSAENQTFAEGVATGRGAELPQQILWEQLDDFVLVSDDLIKQAVVWMLQHAHTLAEGAGAVALAAAYQQRKDWQGKKIGVVCSGGNLSMDHLRMVLG